MAAGRSTGCRDERLEICMESSGLHAYFEARAHSSARRSCGSAKPPVPAAARGKRQVVSSGATGQDKKDKGQASSSKATPAPDEPPVKRQRKAAKK